MAMQVDSFQNLINLYHKDLEASQSFILKGLALVGLFYATRKLIKVAGCCYGYVKAYVFAKFQTASLRKFGEWAVVTGCEDDVSIAFAEELSRIGLNIILIGVRSDKLNETKIILQNQVNTEVETIHIDPNSIENGLNSISNVLLSKNIGIFVNNVMVACEGCTNFFESDLKKIFDFLQYNVSVTTMIFHKVVSYMVERKHGAVVTMCSNLCFFPSPRNVHFAAMAYHSSLVNGMEQELKNEGITILNLTPLNISASSKCRVFRPLNSSVLSPSSSRYAKEALSTLGWSTMTTGCSAHQLQSLLFKTLPGCMGIRRYFSNYFFINY